MPCSVPGGIRSRGGTPAPRAALRTGPRSGRGTLRLPRPIQAPPGHLLSQAQRLPGPDPPRATDPIGLPRPDQPSFPAGPMAQVSHIAAGRICVSAPAAPAASTASPPASTTVAVEGKPTVFVAERMGAAGLPLVQEFAIDCSYGLSPEELRAKTSLCDALIVRSGTKVGRDVFEASGGRLRVIGRVGVGIDGVDLTAATKHGCLVVNAPTANTVAAAEHGIALMCAMAPNIAQADTSLKAGCY
ncbi:D-3-phosphoglycerate dehydrogenase 3, chloroplastic-like [Hordeum vulgare subsp. vulgare]|uniref:D-3-phosphoglycerate dehydrogenase 3, chloroplastic-like n=1 Tax=Hordeum vulgare subsp. vulgare TaxID=112509 RepID=UPI001D1A4D25|nr:D-3-phosphoglycerate dehydrogenase 3, chloroplastic-like [Hordeum vulgare subsp. vulgare]